MIGILAVEFSGNFLKHILVTIKSANSRTVAFHFSFITVTFHRTITTFSLCYPWGICLPARWVEYLNLKENSSSFHFVLKLSNLNSSKINEYYLVSFLNFWLKKSCLRDCLINILQFQDSSENNRWYRYLMISHNKYVM